jgi:uncharacterized protein (DUF736 family)
MALSFQVQWLMPVIPTTLKAEVGGSWSEVSPSKSERPYLKIKLKAK